MNELRSSLGELPIEELDLVNNPSLAEVPETAYAIMSYGMREGFSLNSSQTLARWITVNGQDFFNARQIVNGDKDYTTPGYNYPSGDPESNGHVIADWATSLNNVVLNESLSTVQNPVLQGGSLAGWSTSILNDVQLLQDTVGNWWAQLTTHSPVDLSQAIATPGDAFDLTFDYQFLTTTGGLDVTLNSVPIASVPAPATLSGTSSTFRVTVNDPSLLGQQNAVLDFHFDGITNSQVDLTNITTAAAPPSAYSATEDMTAGGGTAQNISVVYTDDVAMDVSTLQTGNILVTGPNGYSQTATFVGVDNNTDGSPRTATYRITSPNSTWGSGDNGTYTLTMQSSQVGDTRGNYVPYGVVGSFAISIPPAPITDFAWHSAASLPEMPVAQPMGAVLNGKIDVIVGGLSNYSYDPSTNTWSTLASIPQPGIDAGGAAVVNSKLYVIGFGSTPGTEIYDPASNSWSTGAPMPTPRYEGTVAELGGKVYAIGGDDGHGNFVGTVEVYDPATNTWASCAAMPTPRAGAAAVSLNGLIYTFGGAGSDLNRLGGRGGLQSRDQHLGEQIVHADDAIWGRGRGGGREDLRYRRLQTAGPSGDWASVEEYDASTDSWQTLPSSLVSARCSRVRGGCERKRLLACWELLLRRHHNLADRCSTGSLLYRRLEQHHGGPAGNIYGNGGDIQQCHGHQLQRHDSL